MQYIIIFYICVLCKVMYSWNTLDLDIILLPFDLFQKRIRWSLYLRKLVRNIDHFTVSYEANQQIIKYIIRCEVDPGSELVMQMCLVVLSTFLGLSGLSPLNFFTNTQSSDLTSIIYIYYKICVCFISIFCSIGCCIVLYLCFYNGERYLFVNNNNNNIIIIV